MTIQQHTPFQVCMTADKVTCKKKLALGIQRYLTRCAEAEAKKRDVLPDSQQAALHIISNVIQGRFSRSLPASSACSLLLLLLHVNSIINEVIAIKLQELLCVTFHGLPYNPHCLCHTLQAPPL